MSGKPAARVGDTVTCPVPQTGAPGTHAPPPGLPIAPPGAPTVLVGNKSAARMTDSSVCAAPAPTPNALASGAFPVVISAQPAVRMTDPGTHPGSIIMAPCCPTVLIGLSGISGNYQAGNSVCRRMPAGRNPPAGATSPNGAQLGANTPGQSYNNCGVESVRQILHQRGSNVGQEALLNSAIATTNATQPAIGSPSPGNPGTPVTAQNQAWYSGGTVATGQAAILTNNGVPATATPPPAGGNQITDYQHAVAQGRGVIGRVDVQGLPGWNQSGAHAVLITGMEYDDDGNLTHIRYSDTGIGVCDQRATVAQFQKAMDIDTAVSTAGGFALDGMTTTDAPIW